MDSFFPLSHGSPFPSSLFKPFFYDLQHWPSRPCPWHIMRNDAYEILPPPPIPPPLVRCSSEILESGVQGHKGKHIGLQPFLLIIGLGSRQEGGFR